MAELKTKPTKKSFSSYVKELEDKQKQIDCKDLNKLYQTITGSKPVLWGENIVGYGNYRYKYASGREGDWFYAGFAARKSNITLYLMCNPKTSSALFKTLGKHKLSGSCLHIKQLSDIHLDVLSKIITESIAQLKLREKK